jgi:uncharacterized protein YjeT (DUF2065 family)
MKPVDYFLVVGGLIYMFKPNIFRRGIWKQTSLMQRNLSPETYVLVMRVMGFLMVVMGLSRLFYHPLVR